MELEVLALKKVMQKLEENCSHEIAMLEINLPKIEKIPSIKFYEAKEILKALPGIEEIEENDLCRKKKSDFVNTLKKRQVLNLFLSLIIQNQNDLSIMRLQVKNISLKVLTFFFAESRSQPEDNGSMSLRV